MKILKSNSIKKYFELINENPNLFLPNDAPLKIITDINYIESYCTKKNIDLNKIGVIFQDKYITLIRDLVKFPNGNVSTYNRLVNTSILQSGGAGTVILPIVGNKILLIKIFRHPLRRWSIELPRGFGEKDLSPEEIAHKEIAEEIHGKIKQVVPLGIINNNTGLEGNDIQIYLAYLENLGEPNYSEGIDKTILVNIIEFEDMIAQGQITDGFTISAYAKAKIMGKI